MATQVKAINEKLFDKKVKVNFSNRAPLLGMFVKLKDHDDMMKKGFVRFVSWSHMSDDLKYNSVHAKLYLVSTIDSVKPTV